MSLARQARPSPLACARGSNSITSEWNSAESGTACTAGMTIPASSFDRSRMVFKSSSMVESA